MRSNFQSFIIVILLIISIFPLFIDLGSDHSTVKAATLTVDDDGQAGYTTIQAAINAANSGDTIKVWAGTYYENININKQINLVGNSSLDTTINATMSGNGVYVIADGTNVTGFSVSYALASQDSGIKIYYADNCIIKDCNLTNNYYGITVQHSENNLILDNKISTNTYYGIRLFDNSNYNTVRNNSVITTVYALQIMTLSSYNKIENNNGSNSGYSLGVWTNSDFNEINNNTFFNVEGYSYLSGGKGNVLYNNTFVNINDFAIYLYTFHNNKLLNNTIKNTKYAGIRLMWSKHVIASNNSLYNSGFVIYGNYQYQWDSHFLDTSNMVNNKPLYYWKNATGGIIPSGAGQVILANCSNITIENQTITNTSGEICLGFSNYNTIANNTLKTIPTGLAVVTHFSSNNLIINNSCENGLCGIYNGYYSYNNQILNNTCKNGGTKPSWCAAILVYYSTNIRIENNTCTNFNGSGIIIEESENNIVKNNNCSNNIHGLALSTTQGNTIMYNDYHKNENGTYIVGCDDSIFHDNLFLANTNTGILNLYGINNYFYHNCLINNQVQATDPDNNFWNSSLQEGNYWSDYTGLDDGSNGRTAGDGIGDTNIPHLGLDNYPIMIPWGWDKPGTPYLTDPGDLNNTGEYKLVWTHTSRTSGYILEESNSTGSSSNIVIPYEALHFYTVQNKSDGMYFYRVKAYNEHFESAWSNKVNITVDLLPDVPNGLTVKVYPEGNALNISWIPNQFDTKGYYLYVKTTGTWSFLKYNDHPGNSYDHSGLIDGQRYYYRLRAVDSKEQYSNYSSVVDAVPADSVAPAAPTGLLATPKSHESILLTWEPNTEADLEGYNVYRSTDPSPGDWGLPINDKGVLDVESYEDTGLGDQITYYYVVTATDEVPNESEYSNVAEGKTLPGPLPPEIYNPIDNFEIIEDTVDDSTINLHSWFRDPNGDKLTFSVEGDEYIEVVIFQDNGTVILKPEHNWNGKETLTFYAEDITGEVSDEVRITVTPVNDPPQSVKIIEPTNGHEVNDGMDLDFQGSFQDPDKNYGDMFEFEWTSDISGKIGSSQTLSNVILPIGDHYITFTVTDREFASTSAYVNITVLETLESDTDKDGLPNVWERKYGMDPNDPTDASLDSDNDGVINSVEYDLDSDPTNPDTDNDGLSDGDEVYTYFTDPKNADTDGDNHNDSEDKYPLDPYKWKDDQSQSEEGEVLGSDDFWIMAGIIIIVLIVVIILIFLFVLRPRMKKKTEPPVIPIEPANAASMYEPEFQPQPVQVQEAPLTAPEPVQQPFFSPPQPTPGSTPQPVSQPTPVIISSSPQPVPSLMHAESDLEE